MEKATSIRRLALVILVIAACLLIIGGTPANTPKSQASPTEPWTMESVLPASIIRAPLKLTPIHAVILAGTTVEVAVRNDYDKRIVAVKASVDGTFYTRNYLGPGLQDSQKLMSGATDQFLYPKPQNSGDRIRILAVAFHDGTGDGDEREVKNLLDERRARKTQLFRILPYFQLLGRDLQIVDKASTKRGRMRFAALKYAAESLPIETDDGMPLTRGFESGLRAAKAIVLREYVTKLEEALANEPVEAWYDRFGQKATLRLSPNENFRTRFAKIYREFNAFLIRQ